MATWQTIARENMRDARTAAGREGGERTACSRAYYAAFSAATAYLSSTPAVSDYRDGQITPAHRRLPALLTQYGGASGREAATRIRSLYNVRIDADYRNGVVLSRGDAEAAVKLARSVLGLLGVR